MHHIIEFTAESLGRLHFRATKTLKNHAESLHDSCIFLQQCQIHELRTRLIFFKTSKQRTVDRRSEFKCTYSVLMEASR